MFFTYKIQKTDSLITNYIETSMREDDQIAPKCKICFPFKPASTDSIDESFLCFESGTNFDFLIFLTI